MKKIVNVLLVGLVVWGILSYGEILIKSGNAMNETPQYSKCNLWVMCTK